MSEHVEKVSQAVQKLENTISRCPELLELLRTLQSVPEDAYASVLHLLLSEHRSESGSFSTNVLARMAAHEVALDAFRSVRARE